MSQMKSHQFFSKGKVSGDGWSTTESTGRGWEYAYRERWQHDRVVRSTHGVNCTGSCSWKVFVKDGIITWETQQTDYPTNGPDCPEYEPRGCQRGASFSWYIYSPLRIKYPYIRGALLDLYRSELARTGDPVTAWESIVEDPEKSRSYKKERGKGGLVRASWKEVSEIIAAAHVHTVKKYGPDRVAGFSPIPAMSMASYSGGTRFLGLIGGTILSFYDWYCDLPPASPQMWGDQTDVPESGDWWNAGYLIMWGSNLPMTRTPDAHFMTEARYRGQKTVVVSPDYSDHTKFADHWLAANPGTDAALAMAMGHVILKEFFIDRQVDYFTDYTKKFTDMPQLVILDEREGTRVTGRYLRASDLGENSENAEWKTVIIDANTGQPTVPDGSMGDRWGDEGAGRWNLELNGVDPKLSLLGSHDELVEIELSRFDEGEGEGGTTLRRGVPAKRVGDKLVTTVFDLMLAQYGISRDGLPGSWPADYDDTSQPYTPAWQEQHTGVDANLVTRIAREFARNAERTEGRSMVTLGAGTNHWYHSDHIYRAILNMLVMCGCQGVNGGGWAHYVGQEKVRPIAGFAQVAFGLDWVRPPRHQATTAYWYVNSDQWRYETYGADEFSSKVGTGKLDGMHFVDCNAQAARMGWLPSYPSFNRNPLDITDEAEAEGTDIKDYVVRELKDENLQFAAEDPDAPENFPRVLNIWRANLIGGSAKGHEYFLKHLLGVTTAAVRNTETPEDKRPRDVKWRDQAPEGKLDLVTTIDFRMNGTGLHSDIVLPAATWYEKDDISSTDMHPFIHPFNQVIPPAWEAKDDWDIFNLIADTFSKLAEKHLGTRKDLVCLAMQHDTPGELAQPFGEVKDWKKGECEPIPGKTMPDLIPVERDFTAVGEKMKALGPLVEKAGVAWKGVAWKPEQEIEELKVSNGVIRGGPGDGRPSIERGNQVCDAILALSGVSNGRIAVESFKALEKRTGTKLADVAADRADDRITFESIQSQPRKVIASAEWSGMESRERRYSPFTINVERSVPWRTLTGRQQFYLDHEWILEYGEGLATYRPPINLLAHIDDPKLNEDGRDEIVLRYLTPHSKWSIHSTFQDNLHMQTLSRGGPVMWISPEDADKIGVQDNDWIESYNRNGAVSARAVVSHRIPEGSVLMYHVQDRHINVPRTEITKTRGGIHNSLTKISLKPTQMVGGYAQLSYAFNYYGPTGNQRDELVVIRKRKEEVIY